MVQWLPFWTKCSVSDPETLRVTEDLLQAFDVGKISLPALMFQAGYLTLSGYDARGSRYSLAYPNHEVRVAFKEYILEIFTNMRPRQSK